MACRNKTRKIETSTRKMQCRGDECSFTDTYLLSRKWVLISTRTEERGNGGSRGDEGEMSLPPIHHVRDT